MLWFLAAIVLAQPAAAPSLALDYQAPPECPAAASVFDEVKRLRGGLTADDADPDVRARVRVSPNGARWSAEVETFARGGAGRRTLEADTCQRAAEAVAVVLTLALANPLAPLPPPPAPPPVPVAPPPPPPPARIIPFVDVLGAARFGVLPSPMALVQIGGGIEWKWLRLEARYGFAIPAAVIGPTAAAANVESWFQGSLNGCGAVIDTTARLELCVGLDSALLTAAGRGVDYPNQGSALWLGLLGGATARSQLWRGLGVVLDTGIGVALARPRFFVQQAGTTATVYEAPLLTGRFGLGLQWRW